MRNDVIETDTVQYCHDKCRISKFQTISAYIKRNIASIIAFLSLIANIVIVCIVFPRIETEKNLGFDYMGVIIGILSMLVTALMAWNIYTVIDVRKVKEEAISYIDKKLSEKGRDWATSVMCYSDTLNVDDYLMRKQPELAIDFLFRAIESCIDKPYSESAINSAVTKLYVVCCEYNKDNLFIFKARKNLYISLLSKMSSTYVPSIVEAISKANEDTNCPYKD